MAIDNVVLRLTVQWTNRDNPGAFIPSHAQAVTAYEMTNSFVVSDAVLAAGTMTLDIDINKET